MVAHLVVLDREEPFDGKLRFPDADEKIMTRLGEEGAILELDPPPKGPFGWPGDESRGAGALVAGNYRWTGRGHDRMNQA